MNKLEKYNRILELEIRLFALEREQYGEEEALRKQRERTTRREAELGLVFGNN